MIREALRNWLGVSESPRIEPTLGRPKAQITTSADLYRAFGAGNASESGVTVTPKSASSLPAVEACVKVISESIAQLPINLYRVSDDRRVPATDHWAWPLLKTRPNAWQTSFLFREQATRAYLYRGNAFARKVWSRGRVLELVPLDPHRVDLDIDDRTMAMVYIYRRPDGGEERWTSRDVMHLMGPSDDGFWGLTPIEQHRNAVGEALAMQRYSSRHFANGAKPSAVVTQPEGSEMGDPARRSFREDLEAMYGGENAYKTAVLPAGFKFEPVSLSNRDAQYIESRKFSTSEIARMFRVPPHMIGDLERATFSNIEHQALEFVRYTLMPHLVRWEQTLQRDLLLNDPDYQVKFNVNGLLRGDAKSRAEAQAIWRRIGVLSANEIRRHEDLDPRTDPGGDGYIVEANMRSDDGTAQDTPEQP
ncbi:MAG: phage portal protein [Pseudomonadota bacterium]|nr:phage portal protein [Pseudomonadota bacterium]